MTMNFKVCAWLKEGEKVLVELSSHLPKESLKPGMYLTLKELISLNDRRGSEAPTAQERKQLYRYIMDSRLAVNPKARVDRQTQRFTMRYK